MSTLLLSLTLLFFGDPKAEKVLADMQKASGFENAQLDSYKMEMKMTMAMMGMEISMTSYREGENSLTKMVMPNGMGSATQGCAGDLCWDANPMTGTRRLEGKEKDLIQMNSYADYSKWLESMKSISYAGMEEDFHVIKMETESGAPITMWINDKTKFIEKMEVLVSSPMGEMPMSLNFDEYKVFEDKYHFPVKISTSVMNQDIVYELLTFESNVDVDDSLFTPPEGI